MNSTFSIFFLFHFKVFLSFPFVSFLFVEIFPFYVFVYYPMGFRQKVRQMKYEFSRGTTIVWIARFIIIIGISYLLEHLMTSVLGILSFLFDFRLTVWIFCVQFDSRSTVFKLFQLSLKVVSAISYQISIFSPNDSPSKTMKNVFYFI